MKNSIAIVGGGILAIVLIVGVISGLNAQQSSSPSKSSSPSSKVRIQKKGDVSLSLIDGKTISLADYQGKKPVILDFFATWCPNCRRNTPHLNELYKKYKGTVEVVGVNLGEDSGTVRKFVSDYALAFPVALDPLGNIARQFDVQYTNMHVLISKDGTILKVVPGDIRESDIRALVQ